MTFYETLLSCIRIGLSLSDVSQMDFGEMIDIVITFNNRFLIDDEKPKVRNATQKDFDAF